jgi:hypothetical protein
MVRSAALIPSSAEQAKHHNRANAPFAARLGAGLMTV